MFSIVIATDSFKGSLSSREASTIISSVATQYIPDVNVSTFEIGDGGEGTAKAIANALGSTVHSATVSDALGRKTDADWYELSNGEVIVELAEAVGIDKLHPDELDIWHSSTYGFGQLINDAIEHGATSITLAIGGSASNDCGMGMLSGLGMNFFDEKNQLLKPMAESLSKVCYIDIDHFNNNVKDITFKVLIDVDNPLLGENGATYTFGPQKGAKAADLPQLEQGIEHFSHLLEHIFANKASFKPGAGAAGGVGFSSLLALNAEPFLGSKWTLDVTGVNSAISHSQLVITGEGHADSQSAHGKVISAVAKASYEANVPCIAFVGGMSKDARILEKHGVGAIIPIVLDITNLDKAIQNAKENLEIAAHRAFQLLVIGKSLCLEGKEGTPND